MSDRGRLCREVETKYSQSGLPLDPVLAEVLFAWKRASAFGQEADWVFASSLKAGELSLRSSKIRCLQTRSSLRGEGIGWHAFRHTYSCMLRQLGVDVKVQQETITPCRH